MNIYKIISFTNLLATPLAPAMLYAHEVYQTLSELNYPNYFAWMIAGLAIVGIEGTGALTFHNATEAWRKQSWSRLGVSILVGVIYTIIMIAGIWVMNIPNFTMALLVLLTVGAYVGSAMFQSFLEERQERTSEVQDEISLLRAKKLLTNAKTRQLKVRVSKPVQRVQSNTVERQITPKAKEIKAVVERDPTLSARAISREVGCSPSTASYWKSHWEAQEENLQNPR